MVALPALVVAVPKLVSRSVAPVASALNAVKVKQRAMRTSGELVADLLAGSWRQQLREPTLTATELATIAPLLLQSGAGALAWRLIRNSPLGTTPSGNELQQAYRLHALQAAVHETNIKQVLTLLRRAGVEPLLVKGWAISRSYPETGLRPYGDIDLCVRPGDYATASDTLRAAGYRYPVDLHQGTRLLDYHGWDEVFLRSRLVLLDQMSV